MGTAVYTFEGVGVVLPILDTCAFPDKYPGILLSVLVALTTLYVFFGIFCYWVLGAGLAAPSITQDLNTHPKYMIVMYITEFLFAFNLFFTYPLVIYPANMVLESYIFVSMKNKSTLRTWLKNIYRGIMVAFTITVAIFFDKTLDKFLALLGSVACTPIAFMLPALFHLKLVAKTFTEKLIDWLLVVFSIIIMFVTSIYTIIHWNAS